MLLWSGEERIGRRYLDNAAAIHHHNSIRHFPSERHFMRHNRHRYTLTRKLGETAANYRHDSGSWSLYQSAVAQHGHFGNLGSRQGTGAFRKYGRS